MTPHGRAAAWCAAASPFHCCSASNPACTVAGALMGVVANSERFPGRPETTGVCLLLRRAQRQHVFRAKPPRSRGEALPWRKLGWTPGPPLTTGATTKREKVRTARTAFWLLPDVELSRAPQRHADTTARSSPRLLSWTTQSAANVCAELQKTRREALPQRASGLPLRPAGRAAETKRGTQFGWHARYSGCCLTLS